MAAHPGANTPSNGIARSTSRTTPVAVRELANMGHKVFMFHSGDTIGRLRLLISVCFGIPSAHQKLLFRGAVLGGNDNTLFSPRLVGERVVYAVDLRVVEVRVKMPGGIADLQLEIPPTLLVSTLRSRIFAATGVDPIFFRLSFGIFALLDDLCLQAYGDVGGSVEELMHIRLRGGTEHLPLSLPSPQPVEVDTTELPDEAEEPPLPVDDPIDQLTADDDSGEEESDLLYARESDTDSTASANSLPGFSGDENCLFNHRRLRLNNFMALCTVPFERPSSEQVAN